MRPGPGPAALLMSPESGADLVAAGIPVEEVYTWHL